MASLSSLSLLYLHNVYTRLDGSAGIDRGSMYAVTLRKDAEIRRFSITATEPSGWEVREEQNSQLVSRHVYDDWHRVERAQMGFAQAVDSLVGEGWISYSTKR